MFNFFFLSFNRLKAMNLNGTTTIKVNNEIARPLIASSENNNNNQHTANNSNRSCSICLSGHGKRCSCLPAKNSNNTNNNDDCIKPVDLAANLDASAATAINTNPKELNVPRTSNKRSHSFHNFNNNNNSRNNNPNNCAISTRPAASSCHPNSPGAKIDFDAARPKFRRSTIYKSTNNQNLSTTKFNFTIVISFITLIFFCCQLPCRAFLLWSYLKHYFAPPPPLTVTETGEEPITLKNDLFYINLVSHLTTLIYFLHCISNPIIYNILSIKFRKAFLSMTTFNKAPDCRLSFRMT